VDRRIHAHSLDCGNLATDAHHLCEEPVLNDSFSTQGAHHEMEFGNVSVLYRHALQYKFVNIVVTDML
jgi:hypothetical protein